MSLVGSESAVGETYESPIVHRIAPTNSSNVIFEVKPFSCEFENGVDVNDEHVLKMFTRESCPLKKLDESELSDVSVLSLPNVFLDKTFIDEIELCHSKWFDTKLSSQGQNLPYPKGECNGSFQTCGRRATIWFCNRNSIISETTCHFRNISM